MRKKTVILICICFTMAVLLYVAFRYQHTSTERLENQYDNEIQQIHSSIDQDQDGIDDQIDILQGALDYVASAPKYKSKYYQTGYPDDGYVIHHNSPWQKKYEQDILEQREDLVGHYRISQ